MTKDEALKLALEALEYAEAGLADIGDADREPGDDLAWCERRAAQALPKTRATITAIREALAQPKSNDNGGKTGWPLGLLQDDHSGLSRWLASKPDARQKVREALAQHDSVQALPEPEQEPVGEVYGWHGQGVGQPLCRFNVTETEMPVGSLLYTTAPQRKPLTDEEIMQLWSNDHDRLSFARAIEAKIKEKNT